MVFHHRGKKFSKLGIFSVHNELKEMKFDSNCVIFENIEVAVSILEESCQEGDYPMLELNGEAVGSPDWLGDAVKKIDNIKKLNTNLRILIDLEFRKGDCLDLLIS